MSEWPPSPQPGSPAPGPHQPPWAQGGFTSDGQDNVSETLPPEDGEAGSQAIPSGSDASGSVASGPDSTSYPPRPPLAPSWPERSYAQAPPPPPAFVPIGAAAEPVSRPPVAWPVPDPEPPRRRRRALAVVGGIVGSLALVGGGVAVGIALQDDNGDPAANSPVPVALQQDPGAAEPSAAEPDPSVIPIQPGPVTEDAEEPVAAVARAVAPSVVRIDTAAGTGSGILYDASGLLVTNAHVVGDFTDVQVQLADGTVIDGTVLGSDPSVDVAVIQIDSDTEFTAATFAPTTTVEVGQLAVAIGSPFGLEQSVTAGIISAVNRAVPSTNVADGSPTVVEMVQTDAPINPGNSGGALVDRQGRVVGMNTSIRTDGTTQGNLGVGFAIPSDTVLLVAGRIVAGESLDSGFLGVSGQDPASGRPGALVTEVVAGGPAEAGGLESGDLLVSINGTPVAGMSELAAKVRLSAPGTVITMEAIRDGAPVELQVTLGTLGS